MKVEEYKLEKGYVKGQFAPKCSECVHAVPTKGLRCMNPDYVADIGGFAVKPDSWCPAFKTKWSNHLKGFRNGNGH